MESWKETIDSIAQEFDSSDINLNEFLSSEQQQGELGTLADLSDEQVRKQTIEEAKAILEETEEEELRTGD